MSRNEWEEGTILLPSSEAVKVRNTLKEAVTKYQDTLYEQAQEFWKVIPPKAKRDKDLYSKYADAFCYGNNPRDTHPRQPGLPAFTGVQEKRRPSYYGIASYEDEYAHKAADLHTLLSKVGGVYYGNKSKPHRAQKTEAQQILGKATGTKFSILLGEACISFSGREVTWDVPQNNHAVDRARAHPLAALLFSTLATVKWTRGSGGEIVGNDEYNQDTTYAGGGANYVTQSYGPPRKPTRVTRYY